MTLAELEEVFRYHPPHGNQVNQYAEFRARALDLGRLILETSPPSREQSMAITSLQVTVMWYNAAKAIHEQAPPADVRIWTEPENPLDSKREKG